MCFHASFFLNGTYILFHSNFMISKYVRAKHTLAIISCSWWIAMCKSSGSFVFGSIDPCNRLKFGFSIENTKFVHIYEFMMVIFFSSLYD